MMKGAGRLEKDNWMDGRKREVTDGRHGMEEGRAKRSDRIKRIEQGELFYL